MNRLPQILVVICSLCFLGFPEFAVGSISVRLTGDPTLSTDSELILQMSHVESGEFTSEDTVVFNGVERKKLVGGGWGPIVGKAKVIFHTWPGFSESLKNHRYVSDYSDWLNREIFITASSMHVAFEKEEFDYRGWKKVIEINKGTLVWTEDAGMRAVVEFLDLRNVLGDNYSIAKKITEKFGHFRQVFSLDDSEPTYFVIHFPVVKTSLVLTPDNLPRAKVDFSIGLPRDPNFGVNVNINAMGNDAIALFRYMGGDSVVSVEGISHTELNRCFVPEGEELFVVGDMNVNLAQGGDTGIIRITVTDRRQQEPNPEEIVLKAPEVQSGSGEITPDPQQVTTTSGPLEGRDENIPDLETLIINLKDPDLRIRTQAVRAMAQMRDARTVEPLGSLLGDGEWVVRTEAVKALGNIEGTRAEELLIEALGDSDCIVRSIAAQRIRLRQIKGDRVLPKLIAALRMNDNGICGNNRKTVWALMEFPQATEPLMAMLGETNLDGDVRRNIELILAQFPQSEGPLLRILGNEENNVELRSSAAAVFGLKRDVRVVELLLSALENKSSNDTFRKSAARALGEIGDFRAVESLIAVLMSDDASSLLPAEAATALGKIGDVRAIEPLMSISRGHPDPWLRVQVEVALERLQSSIGEK